MPSEYVSVAGDAGWPEACSGERYCTVPMTWPVAVSGNLVGDAGDAEVGDLDPAVRGDEQVSGLDVAVHEAGGVRGLQSRRRLGDDVEGPVRAQRSVALDDRGERLAGHELHDEEGTAVLLAVVEDARDAFMIDQCGMPGLSAEALEESRIPHVLDP